MKKLVCLFVLLLAVSVNAGTITGVSTGVGTPVGYFYDPPKIGNESRIIVWSNEPESSWGGGHRDLVQIFTPDVSLLMEDFSFRMDPRGGDSAAYIPSGAGREMGLELYEMSTASTYDIGLAGTLQTSWTGMVTGAQVNGSAPNSWFTFSFGEAYSLNAGVTYAVKFGFTYPVGSSKWDGGFLSYGIFDPEAYAGNWAVYTGGDPQVYYKTWRTGRYAISPEPATLALLSLGGLLLRRRK